MVTENGPILRGNSPAEYSIHVVGNLDESWSDYLEGLVIQPPSGVRTGSTPVTIISGVLTDQSILNSVLNKLYSLGMLLLYVQCQSFEREKQTN